MQKNKHRISAIFALLAIAFVISGCKQSTPAPSVQPNTNVNAAPEAGVNAESQGEARTFDITASNFSYDVKEIRVKKGDTVTINFTNKEGFHDWVIDDFVTRTKQLKEGESATVTFVASKTGTFEYYCSVGQHRKFGMVGNLIVE